MRDDMMPPGDRSIRNIPLSAAHRRAVETREDEEYEALPPRRAPRPPRKRRGFLYLSIAIVVICAVLGVLLSTLFAGAAVTVYSRAQEVAAPATIQANVSPAAGGLAYTSMTVTRSATTTVSASGTKQVSRPATGVITIYNNYSGEKQRLITNTRFEAPDGKIYRIHEPVEVPGTTKAANGTLTPGTATASVFADSAGPEYNRGATRFTVPGFKGDPRYSTFYAETSAITGGFVGAEPAVADADLTRAQTLLRQGLESAVNSAITSQIPDGFLPVANAFEITYAAIAQSPGEGNTAILSQSATAVTAIVRNTDLAAAIARVKVEGYAGESLSIKAGSNFTVSVASTTKPVGPLNLTLSGNPTLVWKYDPVALKQALLGKQKSSFESILESFRPAITKADAKVRPFWQGSFPSGPEKITITTAEGL